jgi:hypothetical protein
MSEEKKVTILYANRASPTKTIIILTHLGNGELTLPFSRKEDIL